MSVTVLNVNETLQLHLVGHLSLVVNLYSTLCFFLRWRHLETYFPLKRLAVKRSKWKKIWINKKLAYDIISKFVSAIGEMRWVNKDLHTGWRRKKELRFVRLFAKQIIKLYVNIAWERNDLARVIASTEDNTNLCFAHRSFAWHDCFVRQSLER